MYSTNKDMHGTGFFVEVRENFSSMCFEDECSSPRSRHF
jgi:hypothetical protein